MGATHNFPVLRGIQAGREYYLAMCPLKLISKLFIYDEEPLPPELRAQRTLNKSRVPEITKYIVENPKGYVLSAITASIGCEAHFQSVDEADDGLDVGWLSVPMGATIVVNDGQHRRAAIEDAIKQRPELADETIAVVFFIDAGLRRSQQMFADLNKHAVRPSRSLGVLYDYRDPIALLVRELAEEVPIFKDLTEREKTSISNRSPKLFTLSGIYQATKALLQKGDHDGINDVEKQLAITYWTELSHVIPEWETICHKGERCAALREGYVHAHGVALHALGVAGADLISQYPDDWQERLQALRKLDWSRANTSLWEGRAMLQGRISKALRQVILTTNLIKKTLGLSLRAEELKLEQKYMATQGGRDDR